MTPGATEQIVEVRGEAVPVTIVDPVPGALEPATGRDVLFLHGYARRPLDYRLFLDALAQRGHRVVAPFLYANNALKRPPRHFWACAAITLRTAQSLVARELLEPGAIAIGHSTGGAVALALGRLEPAPAAIFAVNPVQPSRRSPLEFMARSAWMNTKLFLGMAGEGKRARKMLSSTTVDFYGNWFRKPLASTELIGGLRAFRYESLGRWMGPPLPREIPARVVYGCGDEFYPGFEGLEVGLRGIFEPFDLVVLEDENSHEWLMVRPARAAGELTRFLAPLGPASPRSSEPASPRSSEPASPRSSEPASPRSSEPASPRSSE